MYVNFLIDKMIREVTMKIIKFVDSILTRGIKVDDEDKHKNSGIVACDDQKINYVVYAAIEYASGSFAVCTMAANYLLSELRSQDAPFTANEIIHEFSLEDGDSIILILARNDTRISRVKILFGDEQKWQVDGIETPGPFLGMIENCI